MVPTVKKDLSVPCAVRKKEGRHVREANGRVERTMVPIATLLSRIAVLQKSKGSRKSKLLYGNRSRVEQDAGSGFAVQAGIDGLAEPLVDGTFLEAAGF